MNYMKFVTLTLASALISTSAFAAQGAYGTWKFPQVDVGSLSIVTTMTVGQGVVSTTATCSMNGRSSEATVSAPATISETQITVTGSASQEISAPTECNANISPSTMDYSVSADDATLTLSAQGQSIALPRQ